MTGSEKRAAEFVAAVKRALATVPPPRLEPGPDLEAAAAELVERLLAVYPQPRRGPLIGLRALLDAYGPDSYLVRHARFLMKLHQFGWRYRGLQHREAAGLPAPLVQEPDLDALAAELVELYRDRHRAVEARRGCVPAT